MDSHVTPLWATNCKYDDFQSPGSTSFLTRGSCSTSFLGKSGRENWGLENAPQYFRLKYVDLLFSLASGKFRVRGEGCTPEDGWSHLIPQDLVNAGGNHPVQESL